MVDDSDRVYRPSGNGAAHWEGAEQPWPPEEPAPGSADQASAEPGAPVHGGPPVPPPPPPIRVPAPPAPPPINRPGMATPVSPPAAGFPPPPATSRPAPPAHGGPAAPIYRPPAPPQPGPAYPPPANRQPSPAPGQPVAPPTVAAHGRPIAQPTAPQAGPGQGQPAGSHTGPQGQPTAPHPGQGHGQPTAPHAQPAAPQAEQPTAPGRPMSPAPAPVPGPASTATGSASVPAGGPVPAAQQESATPPEQRGPAQQTAAVPMQRNGDGQVAGTPWAQPPQRPPAPPAAGQAQVRTADQPAAPPPPAGQAPVRPPDAPPPPPAGQAPVRPADAGPPAADEPHEHPLPPDISAVHQQQPQEIAPGVVEVPQQGVYRMPAPSTAPATANPRTEWTPDGAVPTADDFARRRALRPADPVATTGMRAVLNRSGLVKLPPGAHERERRQDIETIRRNFGGLRQVTVVNPKGGAGKTVAILLLAMTFGQKRGGYVLAWDNNETQGTLGMRAQQDFHNRTVRDLMRDLAQFRGAHGRVGDLSQYVRAQGEGMFDVLASDESATAGEMLTAAAFAHIRDVVSRFYKLIFVDTGNNVRAQNWQAAIDATDQLVVTMSARNDSAETAARMLDHLEQTGRHRLVRQAVTVVSMPPSRREIDLPPIESHFAARTRAVLLAPYERLIDTGEPIRYAGVSKESRDAWLKIAAAVAEGL
ncbi:chromosome partitioning protein [Asanoa sp. WMMD1127]|uniref:MinD/ParA family ATP-binding protein n=1 Tax=Asanoa sp. WMMD1127 TaxID=3016107 RepID=UPI0024160D71|nr:chromosome partitioning protein [Asanoa sp. WMMD1127]MDG4822322.1 chromosome partitioning protein [Asanoa sp. WMMD1127]